MTNIQNPNSLTALIKSEFEKLNSRFDQLEEKVSRMDTTMSMAIDEDIMDSAGGTYPRLNLRFNYDKVERKFFNSPSSLEDLLELPSHEKLKEFYHTLK